MNSIHIIAIIVSIFVLTGLALPYVHQAFNQSYSDVNLDTFESNVREDVGDTVSLGDISASVFKMFFWTFGDLPFWLDAIFLILRIVLIVALVEVILP